MTQSFLEFRETLWGITDGRTILVKDLALDHLVNILNWVKDRPKLYKADLHPLLEQEATFRKMILFASGSTMPCRSEDGHWYLVDSKTGDTIEPEPRTDYTNPLDMNLPNNS